MQRPQVQDYEEIECLQESNFKPDKRCHQSINTVAPPNSIFTSLFFCSAFIVSEVNEPLEQAKKNVIYITARSSSSLHVQQNTSFSLRFSGDNNFALEVVLIRVYSLTGNKLNTVWVRRIDCRLGESNRPRSVCHDLKWIVLLPVREIYFRCKHYELTSGESSGGQQLTTALSSCLLDMYG